MKNFEFFGRSVGKVVDSSSMEGFTARELCVLIFNALDAFLENREAPFVFVSAEFSSKQVLWIKIVMIIRTLFICHRSTLKPVHCSSTESLETQATKTRHKTTKASFILLLFTSTARLQMTTNSLRISQFVKSLSKLICGHELFGLSERSFEAEISKKKTLCKTESCLLAFNMLPNFLGINF